MQKNDEKEQSISISQEEYNRLKEIEKNQGEQQNAPQKTHIIYDNINISVKTLDKIIIGGIVVVVIAIIYGIIAGAKL